jgi:hypothetical protein
MSMKNKIDTIGDRICDLPAFTAVPPLCITVRKFYPEFYFYFFYKFAAIFWGVGQAMEPFGAPVNLNSDFELSKKKIVVLKVRCHSII